MFVYSPQSRAFFINDILQNFSDLLKGVNNSVSAKNPCPDSSKKPKKKIKKKPKKKAKKKKRNSPQKKLTMKRDISDFASKCFGSESPDSFEDSISLAVKMHMKPQIPIPNELKSNGSRKRKGLYKNKGIPSSPDDNVKVGLLSNPMCKVDLKTFRKKSVGPSDEAIEKANLLVDQYNEIRQDYLDAKNEEEKKLLKINAEKLWSKFFNALAVTETLGGKDDKKILVVDKSSDDFETIKKKYSSISLDENLSEQVPVPVPWKSKKDYSDLKKVSIYDWAVDRYDIKGYAKPKDVLIYYDFAHKTSFNSRFNVGLFQFSPVASGNISHCIDRWNEDFKDNQSCQITDEMKKSTGEMLKIVGGSEQAFNSYCGANKILSNLQVQVNTTHTKPLRTHPDNIKEDGSLKDPSDRCVTLHFDSKKSYNHFGTLHKGGAVENSKGKVVKRIGIDRLYHNLYKDPVQPKR